MTQPGQATYRYSIDREDTLVSVDEQWLRFAQENDAPELTEESVLGRSLWTFVKGRETRDLYELLFEKVRSGKDRVSVPFRCDSPDALRFMRLELSPSRAAGLDMTAVVERVEPRRHMRVLERLVQRADYTFDTCSFCRRIFAFGAWLELEEAVARLEWLETGKPPELAEVVCDACTRRCRGRIEGARDPGQP